ncbi:transposase family protein, partial [Escherichia coli]
MEHISVIPDYRQAWKVEHKLSDILLLTICAVISGAKWHLNRSQFGIRIDHDLASISDHSLASQSITIWHAS